MIEQFIKLVFLSIACGAISMTLSKSILFAGIRTWTTQRSKFFGEGLSCPYCTSHWVSFVLSLIYFPRPINSGLLVVDFFVNMMMLVALTPITARIIFLAYAGMGE